MDIKKKFVPTFLVELERLGYKNRQSRADYCGWSYPYQQVIEEGKKIPSEKTLIKLVQKMGLSREDQANMLLLAQADRRSGDGDNPLDGATVTIRNLSGPVINGKTTPRNPDEFHVVNISKSPDNESVGKRRQFDPETLRDAILIVDSILKKNDLEIEIEDYAELIPLAYEECLDDGIDAKDKQKRLLRLVINK